MSFGWPVPRWRWVRSRRRRPVVAHFLAVGILATSLVGCVDSGIPDDAAGGPAAAVERLFRLVDEERFGEVPSLVCEEERQAVLSTVDPSAGLANSLPGVDTTFLSGAVDVGVTDLRVRVVERTPDRAIVRAAGTLTMDADQERLRAVLIPVVDQQGLPRGMLDSLLASMDGQAPIDLRREVVRRNGTWLVCREV